MRSSDRFDAVADGVADQVQHRVHHPLDQELVDLGALPPQLEVHALAGLAREIADDERHAAEDLADRHEADAHDPFAQRPQLAVDRDGVLLNRAPLGRGDAALDARQRVGQAGAADHQVADVAHQLVEAREVDADEVRRRHASACRESPSIAAAALAAAAADVDGGLVLGVGLDDRFDDDAVRRATPSSVASSRSRGDLELERDRAFGA